MAELENPAYCRSLTPAKALAGLAIGGYRDLEAGLLVIGHINQAIIKIIEHFNVPAMNASQISGCVDLLMEKHSDWSVEDFTVWVKTIRMGNVNGLEYPKSFHRIDPDMVIQFAGVYNEVKIEAREQDIQKKKSEILMQERMQVTEGMTPEQLDGLAKAKAIVEEIKNKTKPEYHGSGHGEKMKEKFAAEAKPVNFYDNTESMKRMIDTKIKDYGPDHVRAEIKVYKESYHHGMSENEKANNPFPGWITYADEKLSQL